MSSREVKLLTLEPMDLLAVGHTGPYMSIGDAFYTLAQWLGERQVRTSGGRLLGIYYDDPETVEPAKLRAKAAIHLDPPQDVTVGGPVERVQLRGGKHARLLHAGPYEGLMQAWNWFYGDWLAGSGEQADFAAPSFEVYLNTPEEVAPEALKTELYLPLL